MYFIFLLRAQVRGKASLSTARSGMRAWFCLPDLFLCYAGLLIQLRMAEVCFTEIGSHQTSSTERGGTQVSSTEISLLEVGFCELGSALQPHF